MKNLVEQLLAKEGFSPSECILADFLLKNFRLLAGMSTRQLAKEAYTNSAAIVRFSQKLGFGGYTEFKVQFLAEMMERIRNPQVTDFSMTDRDTVQSLMDKVTGLEVEKLLADLSCFGNDAGLDDDASVLMRLSGGAKASFVTSKIATGEENGVRLRVYGQKASLYWDQEAPNYLTVRYPTRPDRIYRRKASYVGEWSKASVRASRFPAGHHEGFVEALANVYDSFVAAVRSRKKGDFHDECAGIRSMRFVTACLKSAKAKSAWTRL